MLSWRAMPPETTVQHFDDFFEHLTPPATTQLQDSTIPYLVVIDDAVARDVMMHISAVKVEQAGLLLGAVYVDDTTNPQRYAVWVKTAIPADGGHATSVSVVIPPSTWNAATPFLDAGQMALGWYHSHPNLGAFFSGTDRNTQRDHYSMPYQLGWVIDWVRNEQAVFRGIDSQPVPLSAVLLSEWAIRKDAPVALPTQDLAMDSFEEPAELATEPTAGGDERIEPGQANVPENASAADVKECDAKDTTGSR